ncbi:MAG TPA: 16S rRNA (adenine(1518)-N(6)/adenine(1519)-N(6))-dimethyltransferase RsmA [archaeon]|nr:16S rRNA (adenine(1518)-N(6)/adenine(1519)-N(6))-dimethyltransferase RsmA [archaeon]
MKPKYGQHFLTDKLVLHRIIAYADLNKKDTVLEIGGGPGNLTQKLSKAAGRVITIELDRKLADNLKELTKDTNVTVVHGDALKVQFPSFNKVVSNLPYQISSEITFRLLEHQFDFAILMYQLEFADRMIAVAGTSDYSRLTVMAQYHSDIELLEKVPPSAFKPQPKVQSAILKLTPKEPPYRVNDLQFFNRLLKALFSQRRKMLRNSLKAAASMLGFPSENLLKLNPDLLNQRPETLSPEELAELANIIQTGT